MTRQWFGGWGADPLWATVYSWTVDHEHVGGALWWLAGADLSRLYAAADAIGDLPAGARVLDVPSGSGVALRGLRPGQGLDYVAADLAPAMLERTLRTARALGVADQVRTLACDVADLPLDDGSVDLVVSLTGLHCFPDPRQAVREMVRVLAPGGRLTGSAILNDTGLRYGPMRRGGRMSGLVGPSATTTQLRAWLETDGLVDVRLEVDGPLGYVDGTKRRPTRRDQSSSGGGGLLPSRSNDAATSASASMRPTHSAPSTDLPGSRSL